MAKQIKKEYQENNDKEETLNMDSFLEEKDNTEVVEDRHTESEKESDSNNKVDKEKEQLKKELEENQRTIKQMQEQMTALMKMMASNGGGNATVGVSNNDDELVDVGCRCFAGLGMTNADGTQNIFFRCGERKSLTVGDLKSYLKENIRNNKALFSNGLLFFYDESNYDKFRIKKVVDLDEDKVLDIITMADPNDMIRKVAEMTNNLKRDSVVYTLKYIIADMLIRKVDRLKEFTYANHDALEKYFGVKFDTLILNAQMYKFYKSEN